MLFAKDVVHEPPMRWCRNYGTWPGRKEVTPNRASIPLPLEIPYDTYLEAGRRH
jgi:hypothetical protein